jgi:hypothetical protein
MNRSLVKTIPVNETQNRYEVTITGDNCLPPPTFESRQNQLRLLQACVSTPGMLDCGLLPFERLTMVHDGEKWVVTISAIG